MQLGTLEAALRTGEGPFSLRPFSSRNSCMGGKHFCSAKEK